MKNCPCGDQAAPNCTYCKPCNVSRMRDYRKRNPDIMKAIDKRKYDKERSTNLEYCVSRDRAKHLRQAFGMTPEDYEAMLVAQCGSCALCGQIPEDGKLVVDHNHETNEIRELLCTGCNWHLGWVEKVGLQSMNQYLRVA